MNKTTDPNTFFKPRQARPQSLGDSEQGAIVKTLQKKFTKIFMQFINYATKQSHDNFLAPTTFWGS